MEQAKTNVTKKQFDEASCGQIINDCLIIKNNSSQPYKNNKKFLYIYAPNQICVVKDQFRDCAVKIMCMPQLNTVDYCGFYKTRLEELDLPLLETIGDSGFSYICTKTINLPSLKLMTGSQQFYCCEVLISFTAKNLEIIEEYCFQLCVNLKIVIAPKAKIKDHAFSGCQSLETVLINDQYNFKCSCDNCPKCNGTFFQCIKRGKEIIESEQNNLKLEELNISIEKTANQQQIMSKLVDVQNILTQSSTNIDFNNQQNQEAQNSMKNEIQQLSCKQNEILNKINEQQVQIKDLTQQVNRIDQNLLNFKHLFEQFAKHMIELTE